jgi:NadR type nicotinamide-nucleotide adenylyltransferase
MLKKIVVIGPESTGKSTLCEQLAHHFHASWCPEYAREFLLENGKDYSYDDLLVIAKGQVGLEEKYISAANAKPISSKAVPLFIDTDMYVMKVWCEFVFNKCHRFILDQIVHRQYDLYLLCNTDLPWIPDELREYPDLPVRQKLFSIYKDIMINQQVPWIEVAGNYSERLETAIGAVNKLMSA